MIVHLAKGWVALGVGIALAGCGREPGAADPSAGLELLGYLRVSDGLSASRLVGAGCIQVVGKNEARAWARFFPLDCPDSAQAFLPIEDLAFEADLFPGSEEDTWLLKQDGTAIGETGPGVQGRKGTREWPLRHLCQLSDPVAEPRPHFGALCEVRFATAEAGRGEPRYQALRLVTLEELAQAKVETLVSLREQVVAERKRISSLQKGQDSLRREVESAREQLQGAREALSEAQRGLQDSLTSNLTSHRNLQRAKAVAELELANREAQILGARIRYARSEQRRAALLKERLEESENALARVAELEKLMAQLAKAPGNQNERETVVRTLLEQSQQALLKEDERKKLEEEATAASAEAGRLNILVQEEAVVLNRIIEKKDELARLDAAARRIPKQP